MTSLLSVTLTMLKDVQIILVDFITGAQNNSVKLNTFRKIFFQSCCCIATTPVTMGDSEFKDELKEGEEEEKEEKEEGKGEEEKKEEEVKLGPGFITGAADSCFTSGGEASCFISGGAGSCFIFALFHRFICSTGQQQWWLQLFYLLKS